MRRITSRDNEMFKALRSLVNDPREIRQQRRTLVDGLHLVGLCLERGVKIQQLLLSEQGLTKPDIQTLLDRTDFGDGLVLRDGLFSEVTGVTNPTGIAAIIDIPVVTRQPITGDVVVLDAVQDAGNVGTIMRTAAAAGVKDFILGAGCAGAWTPRVLRAAQGAHFSLRIREQADLPALLDKCLQRNVLSIATVARDGEPFFSLDLTLPVAWLFGNEGVGLSAELMTKAAKRVTIALASDTESLNVGAAAAICLFEACRQRQSLQR